MKNKTNHFFFKTTLAKKTKIQKKKNKNKQNKALQNRTKQKPYPKTLVVPNA